MGRIYPSLNYNQSINASTATLFIKKKKTAPTFGHQTQYGVSLMQIITVHTGSCPPRVHCSVVAIELHHVQWVSVSMVHSCTVLVSTVVLYVVPGVLMAVLFHPQAVQTRYSKHQGDWKWSHPFYRLK